MAASQRGGTFKHDLASSPSGLKAMPERRDLSGQSASRLKGTNLSRDTSECSPVGPEVLLQHRADEAVVRSRMMLRLALHRRFSGTKTPVPIMAGGQGG